jgi:hypothetical protein
MHQCSKCISYTASLTASKYVIASKYLKLGKTKQAGWKDDAWIRISSPGTAI